MKHTPGPWKVSKKVGFAIYPSKLGASYLAFMNNSRDSSEANANLMAAAPDMLEALKELLEVYDPSERKDVHPDIRKAFLKCKLIIIKAKAKGSD